MEAGHSRSRLRVNFHIPLVKSGTYKVKLDSEDDSGLQVEFDFEVALKKEEEKETGSAPIQ